MTRHAWRFFSIVCVLIGLLAMADRAMAASRAYSSKGTAHFTSPTAFAGDGNATHLGRYTEVGAVTFTPTSNPAVLAVGGTTVYTAANGDELHADVTGELNAVTGAITATLTFTGGTGRFSDAVGSSSLTGQLGLDGTITVRTSGHIDY